MTDIDQLADLDVPAQGMEAKPRPWHAGRVLFALARHFNWWQNMMLPEFEIDAGRADLVIISRAGYATEIEIKISLSDWNADRKKWKFQLERPHVARFFYAVPSSLEDRIPEWIPAYAGILIVSDMGLGFDHVRELRAAKRLKATKVPEHLQRRMYEATYYRFWRQHMDIQQKRLHSERKAA